MQKYVQLPGGQGVVGPGMTEQVMRFGYHVVKDLTGEDTTGRGPSP